MLKDEIKKLIRKNRKKPPTQINPLNPQYES
jgi:hypothetical protein